MTCQSEHFSTQVVIIRTNEALESTRSPGVSCKVVVRLQPDLTSKGRLDFALVSTRSREPSATQLSLDEELSVEREGGRVERCSGDRRIHMVGCSDRVGGEE